LVQNEQLLVVKRKTW